MLPIPWAVRGSLVGGLIGLTGLVVYQVDGSVTGRLGAGAGLVLALIDGTIMWVTQLSFGGLLHLGTRSPSEHAPPARIRQVPAGAAQPAAPWTTRWPRTLALVLAALAGAIGTLATIAAAWLGEGLRGYLAAGLAALAGGCGPVVAIWLTERAVAERARRPGH